MFTFEFDVSCLRTLLVFCGVDDDDDDDDDDNSSAEDMED